MNLKKNKKGFTLVELIVVLVIIGILLAMVIPNLTGYIDKAQKKNNEVEARSVYMAAMAVAAENYAAGVKNDSIDMGDLGSLTNVGGDLEGGDITVVNGKITANFTYKNGDFETTVSPSGTMTTVKK